MQKLSKEKYTEIFDSLPENVKDALLSLETVDIIEEIGLRNKLNDASISVLTDLVGDLLMGLVNETDFRKEIETGISVDSTSSGVIAKELIDRIILPLGKEFTRMEESLKPAFAITEAKDMDKKPIILEIKPAETFQSTINNESLQSNPVPTAPQPQAPAPPISVKPIFKDAPFILHQEEAISLKNEPEEVKVSAMRQTFYKPSFSEEHKVKEEKPVAAHLELGSDPEKKSEEPKTVGSGGSRVRIVNYSDMKTEASPFNPSENIMIRPEGNSPQVLIEKTDVPTMSQSNNKQELVQTDMKKKAAVSPENIINLKEENKPGKTEKPNIHPDNVVNLKDLPL